MTKSDRPLNNVPATEAFQKVIGVVLREQVALGYLTDERLNAISVRAAELLTALSIGKVLDIGKDALVVVRDATDEEKAEMEARPDEFPISKRARKTLDI